MMLIQNSCLLYSVLFWALRHAYLPEKLICFALPGSFISMGAAQLACNAPPIILCTNHY